MPSPWCRYVEATNRLELSPTYLPLDGLSSLKLLVASGNAITTIADNALTPVASTLAALDLRNNPLAWVRECTVVFTGTVHKRMGEHPLLADTGGSALPPALCVHLWRIRGGR